MIFILITILKILSIVIPLLISVAYFTIAERKIMGAIQRRKGPNVIGFMGLLQPLADGLKLWASRQVYSELQICTNATADECCEDTVTYLDPYVRNSLQKQRDNSMSLKWK